MTFVNQTKQTIHAVATFCRQIKLDRYLAILLASFWLLVTPAYANPVDANSNHNTDARALGQQIHNRLEQTDRGSDRPKTTGEFLDEARGDVPLDERFHNIVRDSAESLKQLGQEYSGGVQENIRAAQGKINESGKNLIENDRG
ncbi:MAG: hypothetical protein MUF72_22870 [Elainella sp. Prado103]|nr:hypothetical protein [Elainella sp. Prado103]